MPLVNSGRHASVGPGGISLQAMRDISLNLGISEAQVGEIVRLTLHELAQKEDPASVPASVVIGVLRSMGASARQWDRQTIINALIQKGYEYRQIQKQWQSFQSSGPEVTRLREEAKNALDAGRFQEAEQLLRQARDTDLEAVETLEQAARQRRPGSFFRSVFSVLSWAVLPKPRASPCGDSAEKKGSLRLWRREKIGGGPAARIVDTAPGRAYKRAT